MEIGKESGEKSVRSKVIPPAAKLNQLWDKFDQVLTDSQAKKRIAMKKNG